MTTDARERRRVGLVGVPDCYAAAAGYLGSLGYPDGAVGHAVEALIATGTAHQPDDGPFAGAFRSEDVDAVEALLPERPSLDWHPNAAWSVAYSPCDMAREV